MHQQTLASINFSQGVSNAWNTVAAIVPKVAAFIVIMVVGWFLSKLIARVCDRVLRRLGFEKAAERGGISRALEHSKYDTTSLVAKVIYYGLLLVTLQLALGVFGTTPVSTMIHSVVAWLPKGLVAVALVVVAAWIARVVRDLVASALSMLSYGRLLGTLCGGAILALGIIAALGQADVATTITGPVLDASLLTVAGILVVGVGGGLIHPMRQRWERALTSAEREVNSNVMPSVGTPYQQGRSDAMAAADEMRRTPAATAGTARMGGAAGARGGVGASGAGAGGGQGMSGGQGTSGGQGMQGGQSGQSGQSGQGGASGPTEMPGDTGEASGR